MTRGVRRWPLYLIASPAAVAVWSGWVGLGSMCGFGLVHPLPGIWDRFQLDTAITLPVGVEAYAAYALGAWLAPVPVPAAARKFARRSAVGALALGMLGQVAYHVLAAAHAVRAPWPVVVVVACLPVVTLGFGAALTHLLRVPAEHLESAPQTAAEGALGGAPETAPQRVPETVSKPRQRPARALPPSASRRRGVRAPEVVFAAELAAGTLPSIRQVKTRCKVGQDRARSIRDDLAALIQVPAPEPAPVPAWPGLLVQLKSPGYWPGGSPE